MNVAYEAWLDALDWLRSTYGDRVYYTERDIVWTVQTRLANDARLSRPLQVYNDYTVRTGSAQYRVDLVVVDRSQDDRPLLVVEFKYEPDHTRGGLAGDIPRGKVDPEVASWSEVIKDVSRVEQMVGSGHAEVGVSILIDEGGYRREKGRKGALDPSQVHTVWSCGGALPRSVHLFTSTFGPR